jgi:hypothetical protein
MKKKKKKRYRDSIQIIADGLYELWKNKVENLLTKIPYEAKENDFENIDPEYWIRIEQSNMVKAAYKGASKLLIYLKTEHKDKLNFSKENLFPREWMNHPKIKNSIDRCPSFYVILNHIHNRNRYFRGEEYRNMIAEANSFIPDIKYEKNNGTRYPIRHDYSTFLTNNSFYRDMLKRTGLSKNTIQRYLAAFYDIGFLKLLYDGKNKGRLYADGYFVEAPDKRKRKVSFMKKDKQMKIGLIRLPELINTYQKKQLKKKKRRCSI